MYDTIQTTVETSGKFKYPAANSGEIKEIVDSEGNFYAGEVKEGSESTKHGVGMLISSIGQLTEGTWEDDKLNGKARVIHGYGDIEIFNSEQGKKHGFCLYNESTGSKAVIEYDHDEEVSKFEQRMSMDELLASTKEEMATS